MPPEEEISPHFTVLGIAGSPRLGGTDFTVRYALECLQELGPVDTLYFSAHKKIINFCIHCDYCIKNKQGCVFKDDMGVLYSMMERADAWVVGTPVYQGSVSAQTKAILDRCRALVAKNPKVFENKVGAVIAVGGDRSGGQELAMQAVHAFFLTNRFLPVGGGAFGANFGAAIWTQDKGAEGAETDEDGLRSVRKLMKRVYRVLSKDEL